MLIEVVGIRHVVPRRGRPVRTLENKPDVGFLIGGKEHEQPCILDLRDLSARLQLCVESKGNLHWAALGLNSLLIWPAYFPVKHQKTVFLLLARNDAYLRALAVRFVFP